MEKKTYYVSLQSREISQVKFGNNHHFVIEATKEEVEQLRGKLNKVADAENDSYWRAHVPFIPYHDDLANDLYDASFTEALQMIHQLGDEQTRAYVESSGVLEGRSLDP